MFGTLITMWQARWREVKSDEGASVVEYTILVAMGALLAGIIAGLVYTAVTSREGDIK